MRIKLIILKFRILKFLGRFIPYFKKMVELKQEDILREFDNILIPHINRYNERHNIDFSIKGLPHIEQFEYADKLCQFIYDFVCENGRIDFQIIISVKNNKVIITLNDENDNENYKIFEFYKYLQSRNDKGLFAEYMKYVKK